MAASKKFFSYSSNSVTLHCVVKHTVVVLEVLKHAFVDLEVLKHPF